jgi:hypothetical protein
MKRLLVFFILIALSFASPSLVSACTTTPEGRPSYTLADQVNAAPIILEGTVLAVSKDSYPFTATVQVQQYFKGSGPQEVIIGNFGSSAMCLTEVSVGDHLIFFASGEPDTGLRAFYMSAGAAVTSASTENIASLMQLLPQQAVENTPQTGGSLPASLLTTLVVLVFLVLGLF